MDELLGKLREARAIALEEKEAGRGSRELFIVITKIEESILWRQEERRLNLPTINECQK